jgi:hypothetical protein
LFIQREGHGDVEGRVCRHGGEHIEQQSVPDVIPAKARYLGWQESLRKLKKLVEPEINQ